MLCTSLERYFTGLLLRKYLLCSLLQLYIYKNVFFFCILAFYVTKFTHYSYKMLDNKSKSCHSTKILLSSSFMTYSLVVVILEVSLLLHQIEITEL